ncbi:hypothetical protein BGZ59_002176 [Podila verticillata]|nr:hypothetical protein BGZ59_002176 [Podila verticillata]
MKFVWIVCGITFLYQFIPQWMFLLLMYVDWLCWIQPFNRNFWALFSSAQGGGILSLSFDWKSIQGQTLYYPLYAQLCTYTGMIFYWILLPIFWLNNILGTRVFGRPLCPKLYYPNGTMFHYNDFSTADHGLDVEKYDAMGVKVTMAPMYALGFFCSFLALAACCSHIGFFHGRKIWHTVYAALSNKEDDIHTKMMKFYPEVPHWWYAVFYIVMAGLSIFVVEYYKLQLPRWALVLALFMGFVLTLPIGILNAITCYGPGLSVISELSCGYMLPVIIDSQREILNGTRFDKNGFWTGARVQTFWGSSLIYGALALHACLRPTGCLARYKKDWWNRYTFILAAAMDTGAAFTGLFLFLFLAGGVSEKMVVGFPSW